MRVRRWERARADGSFASTAAAQRTEGGASWWRAGHERPRTRMDLDGAEMTPGLDAAWPARAAGYLAAPAVENEAGSVRGLPSSPSQGVSRGHQPRTARR